MLIPYDRYLDGEMWPSESKTMAGSGDTYEEVWVGDMPPQYACSAFGKLIRWARDSAVAAQDVAREEDRVRASRLGQLLAARTLWIDDFTITEYVMAHGGLPEKEYAHLELRETARVLAVGMLGIDSALEPDDIGALAVHVAHHLAGNNLALVRLS